jgi:polyferredoxin
MNFHRTVQVFCLALFIGLLTFALTGTLSDLTLDFFLRLDPSVALISVISGKYFSVVFIPAVILVILTLFLGRFFCGYVCPMGTTLDGADQLFGVNYKKRKHWTRQKRWKYLILAVLIGSAVFGVSFLFVASPLSLITRFFGLVIYPLFTFLGTETHRLAMPVFEALDSDSLVFLQIPTVRFATQFFIIIVFVGLFTLSKWTPRFWCRYLCPAGAILGLFSIKPVIRRQTGRSCNNCRKCVRECPMAAIDNEFPSLTQHEECIVCLKCQRICPENAVSFTRQPPKQLPPPLPVVLPDRRRFITAGLAGMGTAAVCLTGLRSVYGKPGYGRMAHPSLIRPPAALPERDFLSRCIRCGECMVACPTNTLQPIWFEAGVMGLFSPVIMPRRGYCDPDCHRCAHVCPTEAIRKIPNHDRLWAKTGTAVINRHTCLAWEHDLKCVVCDEVCPFGAIEIAQEPGITVSVPKVKEYKCLGCGYCEYNCPVQNTAAIIVSPINEMRLPEGSCQLEGLKKGYRITRKEPVDKTYGDSGPPTGGDPSGYGSMPPGGDSESDRLAPGFSNPSASTDAPEPDSAPSGNPKPKQDPKKMPHGRQDAE